MFNPAWRAYRYAGKKSEKKIADEETAQRIIAALENESIQYETYFKLIVATGMRRGECCALQWRDIDWEQCSIHICRNAVKLTSDEIFVKEPKTRSGDRYVYFSAEYDAHYLHLAVQVHPEKERPAGAAQRFGGHCTNLQ